MISKEEAIQLLNSVETYRVERTISTGDMDKFCEAICAFSNDLPDSHKKGYLLIGAFDNGSLSGLKVGDSLIKKIAAIRSDGNILPLPVMTVEKMEFPEGDLLIVEVAPSLLPPVRYRGRVFVRIGPRRDIASEAEERLLTERRTAYMASFDATPCIGASLNDLDLNFIETSYLPAVVGSEILEQDNRDIKEKLASIRLYDRTHDCPTFAAIILFGKHPRYFMPGDYVQYVRFAGKEKGGEVLNERQFQGPLYKMLPALESFVRDAIVTNRPVPVSLFREEILTNYPNDALRELLMNSCMHRDYQSNMPIRLYQFDDHIEIMNAGGLYGEERPENFPKVNDYRNPIIAEAMKEMKYVNMFNQGVRRVQNLLKENGNEKAIFDVSMLTVFAVKIYENVNKNGLKGVTVNNDSLKSYPDEDDTLNDTLKGYAGENGPLNDTLGRSPVKYDTLNDTLNNPLNSLHENSYKLSSTHQKIMELISANGNITHKVMAEKLGIPELRAKRATKFLREKGLLLRIGSKKTGHWKLISS